MYIDDKGIVLRCVKYDDKSFVAHLFTVSSGHVSFMVNGSRGKRSGTSARLFQPLTFLSFQWDAKPKASLQRMKEARLLFVQQSVPLDPIKRSVAMLLSEFMVYTLRDEASNPDLYLYIEHSFQWFDVAEDGYANFHLVFLLRLTKFLGFFPERPMYISGGYFDLQTASYTQFRPPHNDYLEPREAQLIPTLLRMRYENMHLFHFSGAERNHFLSVINNFYRIHIPNFPELKSLAVLRDFYDGMKDF